MHNQFHTKLIQMNTIINAFLVCFRSGRNERYRTDSSDSPHSPSLSTATTVGTQTEKETQTVLCLVTN